MPLLLSTNGATSTLSYSSSTHLTSSLSPKPGSTRLASANWTTITSSARTEKQSEVVVFQFTCGATWRALKSVMEPCLTLGASKCGASSKSTKKRSWLDVSIGLRQLMVVSVMKLVSLQVMRVTCAKPIRQSISWLPVISTFLTSNGSRMVAIAITKVALQASNS